MFFGELVLILALAAFGMSRATGQTNVLAGPILVYDLLPAAYFIVCHGNENGQTVGKMMKKIAVRRDAVDDLSIGYVRSLPRFVVASFLWGAFVIPGIIDVLWALFDGRKQSWHDKIVGSVVVQV